MSSRPPALLRRLLGWIVPRGNAREGLVGDLDELFAERARGGVLGAGLWYLRQVFSAAVHYRIGRPGAAVHGEGRGSMDDVRKDVAYALRTMRRRPGFAAVIVLTLALGIGANTAVFSVVRALVLRAPVGPADFDRLTAIYTSDYSGPPYGTSSYADVRDFGAGVPALAGVAGYGMASVVLSEPDGGRPAEVALIQSVSANYFDVLEVSMPLGRSFGPEEARAGGPATVVLGNAFWRARYGGNGDVVGRTIRLGGTPFTVIGIAPAGFEGLIPAVSPAFYVPIETGMPVTGVDLEERGDRGLFVVARLAEGASVEDARAQLAAVAADLHGRFADRWTDVNDQSRRVTVLPASEAIVPPQVKGQVTAFAAVLMAVVGALLLICCANVANLLLVRATAREREVGVRIALGAGRRRLVRQLLTESLVLAGVGAALGVALAWVGTSALARVRLPVPIALRLNVTPDATVLGFAVVVSVAAAVLFGLAPALMATRGSVSASIRGDAAGGAGGRRLGLRGALAGAQITVAVVLLVMAGLLVRSLVSAQGIDPGFRTTDMLFMDVEQDANTTPPEARLAFHRALRERVRALPGVESVSYTNGLPLTASPNRRSYGVEGYVAGAQEDMELNTTSSGPGYLEAMGIALRAGRDFNEADGPDAPTVAIVNETFVRRYLGGASPLGKRLSRGRNGDLDIEIVGVAQDGKYRTLSEEPLPFVYLAADQNVSPQVTLVVRTRPGVAAPADALRGAVAELAPDAAVTNVATPEQHLLVALLPQRAGATLLGIFGVLGLALASLGVYGVMAFAARRRSHEIGVRMALGARSGDIVRMVVRQGMGVAIVGGVLGLAIAAGLTRALGFLLFGIEPLDPVTFVAASAVVALVTLVANWVPARRSAATSPVSVLKGD